MGVNIAIVSSFILCIVEIVSGRRAVGEEVCILNIEEAYVGRKLEKGREREEVDGRGEG